MGLGIKLFLFCFKIICNRLHYREEQKPPLNDSIISFNKNQIKFCSSAITDPTFALEIRYKKLLIKCSQNNINSSIAHR